jgi:hypothetical protein
MKSKITINIDSELLNLLKQHHLAMDIDSLIQDALAKFLGIKQIWVKIDNSEKEISPAEEVPINPIQEMTINSETEIVPKIKKQRKPKRILKIWEKIKSDLNYEFTIDEYWDTVKKSGSYKNSARTSTILDHMRLLGNAGKIVKIGEKPMKYRKLEDENINIEKSNFEETTKDSEMVRETN